MLLAAALRFGWVGVNSFAFDEARLSLIALRMVRDGDFALFGMPSSAGVPNPPAAAWLFALPYAVSTDPLVATGFVSLVSLLTVIGVWWLARQMWGVPAALSAALLLAGSPYMVLYGRSIWAQNLLPPLALLWAVTAWRSLTGQRRGWLVAHVFLAGFIWQVHLAGAGLALGTAYLFVRFGWYRRLRDVIIGGLLALLALVPFAYGLLTQPDVTARFSSALRQPPQIDLIALKNLLVLTLGVDWAFLAGGDLTGDPFPLGWIVIPLLLAGTAVLVGTWRTGSAARRAQVELLLVWLLATPLFFLRHSTPVFPHYLLGSLPAAALIIGASARLWQSNLCKGLLGVVSFCLAIVWGVQVGASLSQAGEQEAPNGLGTPLGWLRAAAYALPDDAPVLFFTHGDDPNLDGEAAVFSVLWWTRPHRIINGESLLILPAEPAYLMATLPPFPAWEALRSGGLAPDADSLTFPRRQGALPFIAVAYDGASLPTGFTAIDPIRFESGAQLEGWGIRRIGERLRVSTLWRVVDSPPPSTVQQFHHLRSPDQPAGEPLAGADVPLSVHQWRVGDHLVVMGDFFEVPPGDYWVDVGHYTLPDVVRFSHANAGDFVRLGTFTYP